jgi:hypothetical protein
LEFIDESSKSHEQILKQIEQEPYLRVFDPRSRSP